MGNSLKSARRALPAAALALDALALPAGAAGPGIGTTGPDVTVTTWEENSTPETEASPLRDDIVTAYRAAVGTRFQNAPIVPYMSAGATDGAYLRSVGIPVYGLGGSWGIVGEKGGAHGLDEKVWIDGFHGQVPITVDLLKRLAG